MKANYHTHTYRCLHAIGSDREYVENAITGGLRVLGFSDHCPFSFGNGFRSHMRMTPKDIDGYFSSLSDLKKEYEKDITIYIGFEAEYIPQLYDDFKRSVEGYPVDYLIMGQHYFEPETYGRYVGGHGEPGFLNEYVDSIIAGLETGEFKYLAHPDLPRTPANREEYFEQYKRLCLYLKEKDIPVEFNMLGFDEYRWYPSDEFFKIAASVGNKLVIGCDAHEPHVLSNKQLHEETLKAAKNHGMEIIELLPGLGVKSNE